MSGALSDIRVIDLTQMLAGPYGTMVLADHGAQVIKVEPPNGDMTRGPLGSGGQQRELGGYFQSIDRNKESVVLDLKTEGGKSALKERCTWRSPLTMRAPVPLNALAEFR